MEYELYTDGSHIKGTTRLGIGAVLVKNGVELDRLSKLINQTMFKIQYGIDDNVSNPTMELLALLVSLQEFKKHFKPGDRILNIADYMGVGGWMTNKWKINKNYIRIIKNNIDEEIETQKLELSYAYVKSHSGNKFNELVDNLANPR